MCNEPHNSQTEEKAAHRYVPRIAERREELKAKEDAKMKARTASADAEMKKARRGLASARAGLSGDQN